MPKMTKTSSISSLSVQIEKVTTRHRAPCVLCEKAPQRLRLKVSKGSGKWAKTTIYCAEHGHDYLTGLRCDVRNMRDELEKEIERE